MSLIDDVRREREEREQLIQRLKNKTCFDVASRNRDIQTGTLESYHVNNGLTMDLIHLVFDVDENGDETDYTMNWLFLSTSGIHGSYLTLDEIEDRLQNPEKYIGDEIWEDGENPCITAMIFQPRRLAVVYEGELEITREDIPYLRDTVSKTVNGVMESQRGNMAN